MRSASGIDAVTVDAFGTLLELVDPVEALRAALGRRGVERGEDTVRSAFRAEVAHYRPRSLAGRDAVGLAALREECVGVFLSAAEADLPPASFVDAFISSIDFAPADGALRALEQIAAAGIALGCVANWDIGLHDHLRRAGIAQRFHTVLPSAEAGYEKPDPRIFAVALERLAVEPGRAVHIGDEEADRRGALLAGMGFEPVPLASLPARLGLGQ